MRKAELDTPALVVDRRTLERNIRRMQERAETFGVRLRPHTKTHKTPQIARLQLDRGAAGITVAKLGEAEVMADAGIDDILIANQVVGAAKMPRLRRLADRVRLAVLVDSAEGAEILDRAFGDSAEPLDVLIEVDTGKGRCGLSDLEGIVRLAAVVADGPGLHLRGLETHEGHVPVGAESAATIEARARAAGARLVELAERLRSEGHAIDEISVGSTPASPYTAAVAGVTEMRPGTYVFNDVNQMAIGQARPDDCALAVLAGVISRPARDRAVLDAGSKALFAERARVGFALEPRGFGYIRESPAAVIESLSEEHAVVRLPEGAAFPPIAANVEVIPNHVCPAVNLHDRLHLCDGDDVVETWAVAARGRVD